MFGSLNKVQIIGTLGADPESRSFQNGGKVVNLRVACSESWKDKGSGERKEKTEWVSVAVFNDGLGGLIERFLKKGSKVYVEGSLQTRKWQDQSGNDRFTTEVVVRAFGGTVIKLDKKEDGGGSGGGQASGGGGDYTAHGFGGGRGGGYNGGASGGSTHRPAPASFDDLDDDVPF